MKTDIQIAQEAQMLPIGQVASMAGIDENLLEYYGKVKAKIDITPVLRQGEGQDRHHPVAQCAPEGQADSGHRHQPHPCRRGKDHHLGRVSRCPAPHG